MIYFVTARELGLVKIGYAAKPQERFHTIQAHSPVALNLERVRDGDLVVEAALHRQFQAERVRGEWFRMTPEIEAYMNTVPAHQWRHRGWQHSARRLAATSASRKRLEQEAN